MKKIAKSAAVPRVRRVLLVYRQSFWEENRGERGVMARMPGPQRRRVLAGDRSMRRSLQTILRELQRRDLKVRLVERKDLRSIRGHDLMITVGGDGTFFYASHFVRRIPILGVNAAPDLSLGAHCGATAKNFGRVLDQYLSGSAKVVEINRLSIAIKRRKLPIFVVNDILFAHRSPAAMSRYVLVADGRREEQRSSGVWISTASGSTAGIRAAGGRRMPIASQEIQYLVREPYMWPHSLRMIRGVARRSIELVCLMAKASVWVDGTHRQISLALGDRVKIGTGEAPLRVVNLDERRRKRLFP